MADSTLIALEQRGVRTVRDHLSRPARHLARQGLPARARRPPDRRGRRVLRGDHDRRPAPQRRRRARARLPGHPRPARSGHARAGAVGGRRRPGAWPTCIADGRLAVRGRSARARCAGRSRPTPRSASPRSSARSSSSTCACPIPRRRTATAATWTTRATSTPSATPPTRAACSPTMLHACVDMGLGAIAANHEYGRSQFEINLKHGPALDAADRAFRFKARRQGPGRPRGAAGDVHRQALERRRGLGLPPAPLARRRLGPKRPERRRRGGALAASRAT